MGQAGTQSAARDYTVPTKVEKLDSDKEALPTFKFVTAGDYCSAAISSMSLAHSHRRNVHDAVTGDLFTWGAGGHGRLGLGNNITWNSPQLVKEISGIKQVSVSANHMLALDGTRSLLRLFLLIPKTPENSTLGVLRIMVNWVLVSACEKCDQSSSKWKRSLVLFKPDMNLVWPLPRMVLDSCLCYVPISFLGSLFGWGSCANGVLGNGRKVGSIDRPKRIKAGNIVWRYVTD